MKRWFWTWALVNIFLHLHDICYYHAHVRGKNKRSNSVHVNPEFSKCDVLVLSDLNGLNLMGIGKPLYVSNTWVWFVHPTFPCPVIGSSHNVVVML